MKKISLFLLGIVLVLNIYGAENEEASSIEIIKANTTFSEIEKVDSPVLYYKLKGDEKKTGYAVFSDDIKTTKEGMLGKVPLLLVFNNNKKLENIVLLKNNETGVQVQRVIRSKYLYRLTKYVNKESKKIDGIAGATMTTTAIKDCVNDSINKIKGIIADKK